MSTEKKTVNTISELRKEVSNIPRVRLDFAKAMTEMLASHNISVSGDLLGKLVIATCDEVVTEGGEKVLWTDGAIGSDAVGVESLMTNKINSSTPIEAQNLSFIDCN